MKGTRTRQHILDRAVDLASVEGLQGLTIGRLAEDLAMSKSGLFAHFGSKEELQLAAIEAAGRRFMAEAFLPALRAPRGYARLMAICLSWISYAKRNVFPGGCFFAAASFEFDGRPGPVRDAVVGIMDEWIAAIEQAVRMAQEEGELDSDVEPAQLAFELNSFFFGVNFAYQLRHDRKALARAQTAIETRLESLRILKPVRRLRAARR